MDPVYFDNHVVILEKPAGMVTQGEFHELAKEWGRQFFQKQGEIFLEPIHRLDKPASGLVLFAKTSKALSRLNESLRAGALQKTYLALVEGIVEEEGELFHHLSHGEFRAHVVDENDPSGKPAHLLYRRKGIKGHRSLVEIELKTGRYHQIRAQFSHIGHPIVGDGKYGAKESKEEIALHHHQLQFPHPVTKELITVESPAPFSI